MLRDLGVFVSSASLKGLTIDLVITGSIAATESIKLIRALRRLGAEVRVFASKGALQFVTPTALAWAADREPITDFSGTQSHVAEGDACLVAPASAQFIYKMAHGITDTHTSALVASYGGTSKPILLLPTMHESMLNSPAVKANLLSLESWPQLRFLAQRIEESKAKFPDPQILADECSHQIRRQASALPVVICYGGTRAAIDAVRHIGNESSGALGARLVEESYRRGYHTIAVAGRGEKIGSPLADEVHRFCSPQELEWQITECLRRFAHQVHLLFLPAVLDYVPAQEWDEKIRSGQPELQMRLVPTKKIIAGCEVRQGLKFAFKLDDRRDEAAKIAEKYIKQYQLSGLVFNHIDDVQGPNHRATIYDAEVASMTYDSKIEIAQALIARIDAFESRPRGAKGLPLSDHRSL